MIYKNNITFTTFFAIEVPHSIQTTMSKTWLLHRFYTSIEEHIIVQEKNLLLLLLLLHQIDFVISLSLPNNKWKPSPSLATNSSSFEPPLISGTLSLHRLNLLRAAPSKSHR